MKKKKLPYLFLFFSPTSLSLSSCLWRICIHFREGMESSASFNLNGYRPNGDFFTFSFFLPTTKREREMGRKINFFFFSPPVLLILFLRLNAACVACVGCALDSPLTTLSHLVDSPAVAARLEREKKRPARDRAAHTHNNISPWRPIHVSETVYNR